MWRELITALTSDQKPIGDLHPGPGFAEGATKEQISKVELGFGVQLPESLASLLSESNGVQVSFGQHLIWNTDEILRANHREQYDQEASNMLFFGDAGVDGIWFGFEVIGGHTANNQVYAWYPIDKRRELKAPSLRQFIEGWLSGKLKV
jgi:hypothetical protein